MLQEINNKNFSEEVLENPNPSIVIFYKSDVSYDFELSQAQDELLDLGFDFDFFKINVDKNPEFIEKYKLQTFPVMLLFWEGKESDRKISNFNKDSVIDWLQ